MASFEEINNLKDNEVSNSDNTNNKFHPRMAEFIRNEYYVLIFQLVDAGYELSEMEKKDFKKLINTIIDTPHEFNEVLKTGINIPDEYMALSILKYFEFYQKHFNIKNIEGLNVQENENYSFLKEKIKKLINTNQLSNILFKSFREKAKEVANGDYYDFKYTVTDQLILMDGFILKNVSKKEIEEFISLFSQKENRATQLRELMSLYTNNVQKTEVELENKKTINNEIINNQQFKTKFHFLNEDVSIEVLEKLNKIQEIYGIMESDKKNVNTSIEKVYKETLPLLFKQFFAIKKEKREIKNSKGKTSTEILNESLDDIYAFIDEMNKTVVYDNLSGLSADAIYFNEIKKGMRI